MMIKKDSVSVLQGPMDNDPKSSQLKASIHGNSDDALSSGMRFFF